MKIILASASPRRQALVTRLKIPFEIVAPEYEETHHPDEDPETTCRRLAEEKAGLVARRFPGDLVVGADTIVVLGREVLGKPTDSDDARRMLQALSGQTHLVKTAVALVLLDQKHHSGFIETTKVTFHPLETAEIDRYVALDPPLDKAGAYGIQDLSGIFVKQVNGCYHNVVGLPLARFYMHLKEHGLLPSLLTIKPL
ncbi:MAG: septum formation inhibitor Maf [Fidelibacterota bacterium]|nr:MAG: septum formation inhibitor Maf [Candidatus Neomarinimicrobiota bacterium]